MRHVFLVLSFIVAFGYFAHSSYAKIGVGVGTGKIVVDEDLKPGTIYSLPSLTVFNTGDVESDYSVRVAYHNKQPELMPDENWFEFSPAKFRLKGGESQEVTIRLNLPIRTQPGKYFAYIEGYPMAKRNDGTTQVGVAAAAKLYFTTVPGSALDGIYFRLLSMWREYEPWPQRILYVLGAILIFLIAKRFLNIEINLRKPKKAKSTNHED
ncbi:MAG: hypothetical protein IAE95_14535 [Chitinophagaceae bacterium]|nr:hypothetical protein [Chitinophagaceae bacterium]